jgi:hypothetical protein
LRTPPNSKKALGRRETLAKGFFAGIPSVVARNEKSRDTAHEATFKESLRCFSRGRLQKNYERCKKNRQ